MIGAARAALPPEAEIPDAARLGLYNGWPGVAVALARAGRAVEAPELIERANPLNCATLVAHRAEGEDFDIEPISSCLPVASVCDEARRFLVR